MDFLTDINLYQATGVFCLGVLSYCFYLAYKEEKENNIDL
jgi:hypothetical protein